MHKDLETTKETERLAKRRSMSDTPTTPRSPLSKKLSSSNLKASSPSSSDTSNISNEEVSFDDELEVELEGSFLIDQELQKVFHYCFSSYFCCLIVRSMFDIR